MMVKIQITEDEWVEATPVMRARIMELMTEYGYDTKTLEVLEVEANGPTTDDIYRQFYGDEE